MTTTYAQFAPTAFDPKGLGLDDRQDWIVAPVSRTSDSGPLSESNFITAVKIFGGESDTVEIHRFGHWGPGWFEIVLVHPSLASEVEKMEDALNDYPVLDDDDFSAREYDAAHERWGFMSMRERIDLCKRARISILAARRDDPPSEAIDYLMRD